MMTVVCVLLGLALAGSVMVNLLLHWVCEGQAETITELLAEKRTGADRDKDVADVTWRHRAVIEPHIGDTK
jgi:hypothetical protein